MALNNFYFECIIFKYRTILFIVVKKYVLQKNHFIVQF